MRRTAPLGSPRGPIVPVGEPRDVRPDAASRRGRRRNRATGLSVAAVPVGFSADGDGVHYPGGGRLPRRVGPHLVSHGRRQDRSLSGSCRVPYRVAAIEAPGHGRRHRGPHALHAPATDPAAVRAGGAHHLRIGTDPQRGIRHSARTPITAGIWVGGASTPNTFREAGESVAEIEAGRSTARHALLLEKCPWCGTPFGISSYGRQARQLPPPMRQRRMRFRKRRSSAALQRGRRCTLQGAAVPFDQHRRQVRPVRVGSADRCILRRRPVSAPAGTRDSGRTAPHHGTAGFGGRAIRSRFRNAVRSARHTSQVHRLHRDHPHGEGTGETPVCTGLGRFPPPPGLSSDDSYFARTDHAHPGRLYVGYLAPMFDQQHCLAPLAAALLAGPRWVFDRDQERDELLEAWWTQVIYHGSLKGVGNSHKRVRHPCKGLRGPARRRAFAREAIRRGGRGERRRPCRPLQHRLRQVPVPTDRPVDEPADR